MQEFLRSLWQSPHLRTVLLPWAVFFLILQFANTQDGGPNAMSRLLTMRSMSEDTTFSIDGRIQNSEDWARTPDGHYYSNKAPGPMLLGFPTFFIVDQMSRLWEKGYREENGLRRSPGYLHKTVTSLLNQIIPLFFVLALTLLWLQGLAVSVASQVYFLLAVFYGSTVSMYFNNYSGHAFNAILQLGMLLALIRGHFGWVGFCAGAALLSDYGFAAQIPAFCAAVFVAWRVHGGNTRLVGRIFLGAFLPAALWVWYHSSSFGSPFLIANNFQNPVFLDTADQEANLWGIFGLPNWEVLGELLFGRARGILFTQPWLLFILPVAAIAMVSPKIIFAPASRPPKLREASRIAAIFCVLSLAGLLLMNMSFGAWRGGGAAGPRYLSGIFLCFALWLTLNLDYFLPAIRRFFWLCLGFALVFRGLVYASSILGPQTDLWAFYLSEFTKRSKTPHLRFAIYATCLGMSYLWFQRKYKRT